MMMRIIMIIMIRYSKLIKMIMMMILIISVRIRVIVTTIMVNNKMITITN